MIGGRVSVGNRCPWTRENIGPHRGMQTIRLIGYGSSLGERLTGYKNLYSSQPYQILPLNSILEAAILSLLVHMLSCAWWERSRPVYPEMPVRWRPPWGLPWVPGKCPRGDLDCFMAHIVRHTDEHSAYAWKREIEIKFIGLFGDRGHRGPYSPYKPCNHNLHIAIIIFPHIDNPQSIGYN